jgi:YidC/Oxa1 family membrane protein insertase
MFTTLIVQPIFNLLALIYALLPGHNFGVALIIFTVIVRLLMWPLVRRQLHQAKAMRKLQPELKRIKKEAKGDRQKESVMLMELYKERGINPFSSIGILIPQFIILIGLYSGLRRVVDHPSNMVTFAYPAIRHLPWMETLAHNIHRFDNTLLGLVNLTRPAVGPKGLYLPALLIVAASAIMQYYQSKQLLPQDKDARSLRDILRSAGEGKQADTSEVNAAVGRSTVYLLPVMIFLFTVNLPSALSLYWLTGGIVAFIQQSRVLRDDEQEMESLADEKPTKNVDAIPEAEVIPGDTPKAQTKKKRTVKAKSKRRKR